jgi:hypothetical protein
MRPGTVFQPSVVTGLGGAATAHVEFLLVDAAGKTVKAAAPAHLFSKDLLESLRKPDLSKDLLMSPAKPEITKAKAGG